MLRFVGDVNFADGYFDLGFGIGNMAEKGIDPLSNVPLNNSDIWIGNLECVISDITEKKGQRDKCFRLNEEVYKKNVSHLNIYTVANNHLMEHGKEAYKRTLDVISKDSNYVGSNDRRSLIFSHEGKEYGLVSFSSRRESNTKAPLYWYRPEYVNIVNEFNIVKFADFKIIYMHWGNEFISYPYMDQKKFAHWLIELGFDLVVGCHSHVLQGFEKYKGGHVFYSLGNFLFNMSSPETRHSALINIEFVNGEFNVSYDYVKIGSDYKPSIVHSSDFPKRFTFESLNSQLLSDEDNEQYYAKVAANCASYRKQNHFKILKSIHKYPFGAFFEILIDYLKRRLKITLK